MKSSPFNGYHILVELCIVWHATCSKFTGIDYITDVTCGSTQSVFARAARSIIECQTICDTHSTCRSTFWSPGLRQCVGCKAKYDGTSGLPTFPGTLYYEKLEPGCKAQWTPFQHSCYKFEFKELSWYGAQAECAKSGGLLAIIKTKDEMDFISQLFLQASKQATSAVWIGASAQNPTSKDDFRWTDGSRLVDGFNNLRFNKIRSCVYFDPSPSFTWLNDVCASLFWSLCESPSGRLSRRQ